MKSLGLHGCMGVGLVLLGATGCVAQGFFQNLPPSLATVFEKTVFPEVGAAQAADLDRDGTAEVVVLTHSPVAGPSSTLVFQSLLMVFARARVAPGQFPYHLSATRAESASGPRAAHVTLRDVGGGPEPELVWLDRGPDEEGRYSRATILLYTPDHQPALGEVVRFEVREGWVRVHDLDEDGPSELLGFRVAEGQTVCDNLLLYDEDRWRDLSEVLKALGFADLRAFQAARGLQPSGWVTRELLEALKRDLSLAPIPE
ncbi:MAG: hypothetical protein GHCLOJNM_02311 [bacterium]|nr:hypothetical protein [bacterium]